MSGNNILSSQAALLKIYVIGHTIRVDGRVPIAILNRILHNLFPDEILNEFMMENDMFTAGTIQGYCDFIYDNGYFEPSFTLDQLPWMRTDYARGPEKKLFCIAFIPKINSPQEAKEVWKNLRFW